MTAKQINDSNPSRYKEISMAHSKGKAHHFEVVVGNIGTVYSGNSNSDTIMTYIAYADKSGRNEGRASGESVTLFRDGEIVNEYIGTIDSTFEE